MPTATAEIEKRSILEGVDLRLVDRAKHKMPFIEGFAAVFDSVGHPILGMPEFRERVLPGAFKASLNRGDDIRALVDHDSAKIIGRRSANTLEIEETEHGLMVKINPPDTTVGRDVVESVRRGDLTGMSIGFMTASGGSRIVIEDDAEIREVTEVDLFEVSIVVWPAFDATEVAVRSLHQYRRKQYDLRLERNKERVKQFAFPQV